MTESTSEFNSQTSPSQASNGVCVLSTCSLEKNKLEISRAYLVYVHDRDYSADQNSSHNRQPTPRHAGELLAVYCKYFDKPGRVIAGPHCIVLTPARCSPCHQGVRASGRCVVVRPDRCTGRPDGCTGRGIDVVATSVCIILDRAVWYVDTAIDLWALVAFGIAVSEMVTKYNAVSL